MQYRKYEFPPKDWEQLQKEIQEITTINNQNFISWKDCAVVEIGFICLEKEKVKDKETCIRQSDKWAVDILFYAEIPINFEPFEVYPEPTKEVHNFWGDEDLYLKTYCNKYPDSKFCNV